MGMTPSSKPLIWPSSKPSRFPSSTPTRTTSSKTSIITSIIFITVVISFFYKKVIKNHIDIAYEEGESYYDPSEGVESISRPYTALDDQANNFEDNPPTQIRSDEYDLMD